ncbi:hypothetical protein AB0H57_06645 [Micromonospora sp. NPDC050686]|uniref:DUF6414 family protein n=1 Tax=Micromonospora sp. NPDC050686 TaxID=3154631 RepID=UPI0033F39DB0
MTSASADIAISGEGPSITIYQDASYVEGILQQANRGLITDASEAGESRNTHTSKEGETGGGELGADVKLPGVGGIKASAKITADDGTTFEGVAGQQTTRNYKYTSAFYLHHVRQDLRTAGLLKKLTAASDVEELAVGDFVEFQAEFKPDELIALMDVLNPTLVGAITQWARRTQIIPQITNASSEDERQSLILEYQTRPDADAELARAVAEAIRVDFRSIATREYYGAINSIPGVTAVVVCDTRSFLVEDADRILDGHFTVFGKVSTPPAANVPILARNKVLDRIQPQAVDLLTDQLRKLASEKMEDNSGLDARVEEYLDLDFPSRIDGLSFKVVPVAIYI